MKKDPVLKIMGISALSLLALWLVKVTFFQNGYGFSVNYRVPGYMMNNYEHGYNYGYGMSSTSQMLPALIQVLFVIFVVALVLGLIVLVIKHVFTGADIESIKGTFSGNPRKAGRTCSECGKTLDSDWKVCPFCGKEID